MSHLLRDELRVVIAPEQVVLVDIGRTFNMHGLQRRIVLKSVVDCPPADGSKASWDAAIQALEAALPELSGRRVSAKLILSDHFMRYILVPWSEALSDAAEEEAYARHCFRQQFGTDAELWELRLSAEQPDQPQLASAVDTRLLAALRSVFERNGIALDSIQPRLMAAYNNCHDTLQDCSAWFALYEPGSLCLALLQHGRWSSVRTMRIGSNWYETLSLMLERESYLTEPHDKTQDVFLWAPELGNMALPDNERWQIHNLNPVVRPALLPEYEGRFGMALSG